MILHFLFIEYQNLNLKILSGKKYALNEYHISSRLYVILNFNVKYRCYVTGNMGNVLSLKNKQNHAFLQNNGFKFKSLKLDSILSCRNVCKRLVAFMILIQILIPYPSHCIRINDDKYLIFYSPPLSKNDMFNLTQP